MQVRAFVDYQFPAWKNIDMARNRGKPKLSSRDINREPLSEEEHDALENTFFEGPPIVTAILGLSIIEYKLDKVNFILTWIFIKYSLG